MAQVFISYNSCDFDCAKRMFQALKANRIDTWFAPDRIAQGGNFAVEIGRELSEEDGMEERSKQLLRSRVLLLILSRGAMSSDWVRKEVKLAIKKKIALLVAQVDHEPLTDEFEYLLVDVQITDCYRMSKSGVEQIIGEVRKLIPDSAPEQWQEERRRYTEEELRMKRITCGDPYFEEQSTLFVKLSGNEFFLAPPAELLSDGEEELLTWCREHDIALQDRVFGGSLADTVAAIPIPGLAEQIERSRRKVFQQFRSRENGCYYNNKKYGVEDINPFARTADAREMPKLEMRMFLTDYYTHRIMKDVCKTLAAEGVRYLQDIDYARIGNNRIFLTSLGVNLLLEEDVLQENRGVLLTSRSTNSAETYQKQSLSLSVIEGVSISDYDEYQRRISLTLAVERGLVEELNVTKELYQPDSVRFYELFVNCDNLEIGITCTVELKREYTILRDVLRRHGKDEELEIADKRKVEFSELESFLRTNREAFLPQALYTLCALMESNGVLMIDRYRRTVLGKQMFLCSKNGIDAPCGDKIVDSKHYLAVIDGATPKGKRLWDGMRGDVFVSLVLERAIESLPPDMDAAGAVEALNEAVGREYARHGLELSQLEPEEQLQASVLIYNVRRREIWSFGDCMLRINQQSYHNIKKGDIMLSDLRAFAVEAAVLRHQSLRDQGGVDYGREQILPFLKQFTLFANANSSFGYDVINGGAIHRDRVKIYGVQPGDHVVLASDGYPRLFDTLEETERYLQQCIEKDPMCINQLRGTKGIAQGNVSYDDRCFLGFTVE